MGLVTQRLTYWYWHLQSRQLQDQVREMVIQKERLKLMVIVKG